LFCLNDKNKKIKIKIKTKNNKKEIKLNNFIEQENTQNTQSAMPRTTYLKRSNLSTKSAADFKQQEQIKKQILRQLNKEPKEALIDKLDIVKEVVTNNNVNIRPNNNYNNNNNKNKPTPENENHIQVVKKHNNQKPTKNQNNKKLKIMFLGGAGEIGKNMLAVEYGNDIIVVDAGSMFPGEDLPGIDLILPDITYLLQNKHKIRAIVLTHGHEDHIGGLPYLLDQINAPVYGSRMTLALVELKLKEYRNIKPKLITVKEGQSIKAGVFSVEFIYVNHSIAGAFALSVTTPAGIWVHTGDFKIDYTSVEGKTTDLTRLAELGKQGVLVMTADSTNVELEGYTMSETNVGRSLDVVFAQHKEKRMFTATFASNTYRLQQLVDLANKYGRKIAFSGRSMVNVSDVAAKIGELKINKDIIIPIEKIKNYKDSEILILSTGSQGEPFSALTRMAAGNFKGVTLGPNDAIIISASAIPGNEKAVLGVIDNLYKQGCEVIYDALTEVHVSGHAKREELKLMHALVKPKFFVPAHGEYRMLKKHTELAVAMGMQERNTLIPEIGMVIEVTKNSLKANGTVTSGRRLVDGLGFGEMESVVLRDRKQLAEDGLCIVMLGINKASGELVNSPDIITRGLMYANENSITQDAKGVVVATIKDLQLKESEWSIVKEAIRRNLSNHFYKKTKRRPMILTFILES
jgi:ribonuclease J